ncbi:ankyrin [Lenzites betulinus]|nr:ankyrin [Lenzites betulinus]
MTTATYNPSDAFRDAAAYLSNAPALKSVTNATKLELYAIFKYLTVSPYPNTPKPSIFDFTGKAKWDAWRTAGELYGDRPADAEARYLEIARSLEWTEGKEADPEPTSETEEDDGKGIWESDSDGESPKKKHAGEKSTIGRVTSTMVAEDEGSASALSNLAISGNAESLAAHLQEHPEVDINAPDENGYTALHLAADRGHADVVKVLLERGADRDIKDEDEFTARELAEVAGHNEIVNLLSDTPNPSS